MGSSSSRAGSETRRRGEAVPGATPEVVGVDPHLGQRCENHQWQSAKCRVSASTYSPTGEECTSTQTVARTCVELGCGDVVRATGAKADDRERADLLLVRLQRRPPRLELPVAGPARSKFCSAHRDPGECCRDVVAHRAAAARRDPRRELVRARRSGGQHAAERRQEPHHESPAAAAGP